MMIALQYGTNGDAKRLMKNHLNQFTRVKILLFILCFVGRFMSTVTGILVFGTYCLWNLAILFLP
jgi:hypothetical protein